MTPASKEPAAHARQLANLRTAPLPPAPLANQRARTHGGYAAVSHERLGEKALAVFTALAADAPLRDGAGELPAADAALVRLAAECLLRLEDIGQHLGEQGLFDRKGAVRPVVELEGRLRREAADHLDALGMSPRSRGRLGLDLARTAEGLDDYVARAYPPSEPA